MHLVELILCFNSLQYFSNILYLWTSQPDGDFPAIYYTLSIFCQLTWYLTV